MATQTELQQQMADLTAQVTKIGTEIDALKGEVATLQQNVSDLEAALAAQEVTPETQAAFDALKAQVQVVDDKVPDMAPPAGGG